MKKTNEATFIKIREREKERATKTHQTKKIKDYSSQNYSNSNFVFNFVDDEKKNSNASKCARNKIQELYKHTHLCMHIGFSISNFHLLLKT